jgi:hypothetical protein
MMRGALAGALAGGCAAVLLLGAAPAVAGRAAPGRPATFKIYNNGFAGWAVETKLTSAVVEFNAPKVTCTSVQSGISPSLAAVGRKYETYAAVEVECDAGLANYVAAIELNGAPLQEIKETSVHVANGDLIRIAIKETLHATAVTVHDLTNHTFRTETSKSGNPATEAQIGVNGLDLYQDGQPGELLPIMKFAPVHFSHDLLDAKRPGTFLQIAEYIRTSNGSIRGRILAEPTALSDKENFAVDFKRL